MAVVPENLGGYQPICSDCGVALCWSISVYEYVEAMPFWDTWKCDTCNPAYKGALKRWQESPEGKQYKALLMEKLYAT